MKKSEAGKQKGQKLVNDIRCGRITKDYRTNHGDRFQGGLEQLHLSQFKAYLASCSRYLINKRLKVRCYYG